MWLFDVFDRECLCFDTCVPVLRPPLIASNQTDLLYTLLMDLLDFGQRPHVFASRAFRNVICVDWVGCRCALPLLLSPFGQRGCFQSIDHRLKLLLVVYLQNFIRFDLLSVGESSLDIWVLELVFVQVVLYHVKLGDLVVWDVCQNGPQTVTHAIMLDLFVPNVQIG